MTVPQNCIGCRDGAFVARYMMPDGSTLYRCAACGLMVRDPMLSPEKRKTRYSSAGYFSKTSTPEEGLYGYNNYLHDRYLYMWMFSERLDELEQLAPRGRLLDVGCATGVLLDIARLRGWDVQGIDLSTFAVDIARRFYNLDVFEGELLEASYPDEYFDVVTMDDLIEHVTNPRELLAEAARILRPGGVLAINTPNARSLFARCMGRHWFHYKQEEHFYFLTPVSVRLLLGDLGMDVVKIQKSPRVIDLRYLFRRLGYYSETVSRLLLRFGERFLTSRVGFFIYTGEMTVYARKQGGA